jgi:crotonobetaine/carnitine-CoA ligase
LFAWFAANMLGAIAVPLNPALKPTELEGFFELTKPRIVVHEVGDLARAGKGAPRATIGPNDIAVLLATSGTTGAPKAVAQTHRTYTLTAEAFPHWLDLDESDRVLCSLPLSHINAQAYSVMGALGAGARLALVPRFSASSFWDDARRFGSTQTNAVGAMVRILMKGPARRDHAMRTVYAALALPESEHVAFEQRFGVRMTVGYGMSETTFGTIWPKNSARYGTMGTLRQHPRLGEINRARVVGEDGRDAEEGELWLSNPATMSEYWNDPQATSAALVEGWLRTGDRVRRDPDGFFTFVARKKEMLRRRGENIAPAEIENALLEHPSVREAAVIGVPSELGEDDIIAYVAPLGLDVEALTAWLRSRLADYKIPREIRVRDALPKTATERIAKHLLK